MKATCATCKRRHMHILTNSMFEFLDRLKEAGWKVLLTDPNNLRARYQCPDCTKKELMNQNIYTVCFLAFLNGTMTGSVHPVIAAEGEAKAIEAATKQLEVFSKNGLSFRISDVNPVKFLCKLEPNSFIAFSNGLWL